MLLLLHLLTSLVLLKDGSIYGFGLNVFISGIWDYKRNYEIIISKPLKIKINSKVLNIVSCIGSMILDTEQGFMACGNNYFQALGRLNNKSGLQGFNFCNFFK
jgi:hypothetical protein